MEDVFFFVLADFQFMGSVINGQNIFIKQIVYKVVFEVDEKGVEGVVVISIGFGIIFVLFFFWFDQFFVLVFWYIEINMMLFIGYVVDLLVEQIGNYGSSVFDY